MFSFTDMTLTIFTRNKDYDGKMYYLNLIGEQETSLDKESIILTVEMKFNSTILIDSHFNHDQSGN